MSSQAQAGRKWYPLDNAANVYPAVVGRQHPNVFRVSATLRERVVPEPLQQALDTTLKRVPGFSVRMRSGLFWHYFSHSDRLLPIQEDVVNPCMRITHSRDNGFLIRVRYYDRRVALEVFHSVTDGSGALVFLKTLLAQYLSLLGSDIPATHGVLDCEDVPQPSETADDFAAFSGSSTPKPRRLPRAYHVAGTLLPHHEIEIIRGTSPIEAVRAESKRHGVSITEYLTGVYLHVLAGLQDAEHRKRPLPVRVEVPVNLRRFHPSETLRNFSSYVCPRIDPSQGDRTFEETLSSVHHFMRYEITAQNLRSRVAMNIKSERNPLVRALPLFIKNPAIGIVYRLAGPMIYTSVLSNLGVVRVPSEMQAHVEMFDFLLGPARTTGVSCTALGYDDKLRIGFSRVLEEPIVERAFFTFLIGHGIPVKVTSDKEPACPTA